MLLRNRLSALIDQLQQSGYQCIGPVQKKNSIAYEPIESAAELVNGIEIQQSPGKITVINSKKSLNFSWSNGAQAIKPYLFKPKQPLWRCERDENGRLEFAAVQSPVPKYAFIGVRACDVAALLIQDQHFLSDDCGDSFYQAIRSQVFLVGVDCTFPAETCFCVSTGDGPALTSGFDIALSELEEGFLLRADSAAGKQVIEKLDLETADQDSVDDFNQQLQQAKAQMTREIPVGNLYADLIKRKSSQHWEAIAERCLSCGNCTAVCPTCFCSSEYDETTLNKEQQTHVREWSSCFSTEHSYIHGSVVRSQISQRYRQWLTHKLGYWHEQFGRSGCVGCGRCINWCPVGIDLTQEIKLVLSDEES